MKKVKCLSDLKLVNWFDDFGVFNDFDFMIHYANDKEYSSWMSLNYHPNIYTLKTYNRIVNEIKNGNSATIDLLIKNLEGGDFHICSNL